jgi:uncharacterized protein (TIGR02001 family)
MIIRFDVPRGWLGTERWRQTLAVAAIVIACALPGAAGAQVAAQLSVATDDRFRGFSLSGGRPVVGAAITWDDMSGVYVDVQALAASDVGRGFGLLSGAVSLGYAKRLGSERSLDIGVTRTQFTSRYVTGRATDYTDIYAGVTAGMLIARVHLSPHYFGSRTTGGYVELGAAVPLTPGLRLTGHAGLSQRLAYEAHASGINTHYDLSVGATRTFGCVELGLSLDTRGPSQKTRNARSGMARVAVAF